MKQFKTEQASDCQAIEAQLSGYLDGELTQQESQRVYLHLEACPSCHKLYDELKQVKQLVADIEEPKMSEKELEQIMTDMPSRTMASLGWVLVLTTLIGLSVYTAWLFMTDDNVATWFKIIKSALVIGFALLLGSVVRQRFIARKTDKYKKVNL